MQEMKNRFNGYQWHPEQTPEDVVYNPWAVLSFLNGSVNAYPWCHTAMLTNTLTRHVPAILETRLCTWDELTSPWSLAARTQCSSMMDSELLNLKVSLEWRFKFQVVPSQLEVQGVVLVGL